MNKYQENLRERAESIARIHYTYFDGVSCKYRKILVDKCLPIAAYALEREAESAKEMYQEQTECQEENCAICKRKINTYLVNAGLIPPTDQPNSNNSHLK